MQEIFIDKRIATHVAGLIYFAPNTKTITFVPPRKQNKSSTDMRTIDQLFINSTQAVSRMNEWTQARKAFFFLTDFEAGQCFVETTDSLPVGELQFEFPDISHRGKQKQTEMPEEIR